jgi:RNA polymerase primary sigma factor
MTRYDSYRDESHDLLNQYLQEIARVPRLTPEEERELGRKVQQESDVLALDKLVKANLRFVVSYAKRFRNSHVHFLDLINEGNIGLIQAAKKYDPEKNVKFITYAVWWIRQAILHALSEQGGAFRIPPKRANMMYRLEKMISTIHNEQNRIPTNAELAIDLGVDEKEIESLLQISNENFSLNAELSEDGDTELGDLIEQEMMPSVEVELEHQGIRDELLRQMQVQLTPKERLVLTLRHGLTDNEPKRIREVADFLGRDSESTSGTLTTAINKLRDALDVSEGELAYLLLATNPNEDANEKFWELDDLTSTTMIRLDPHRLSLLGKLQQNGAVQREIEKLPVDEKTILQLRYGVLQDEELTLRDIGLILNLSRERVRQIEARAEAKCRRSVKRDTLMHH